eukprot:SAG11_NODE_2470_length_3319_cov_30.880435_3_plen_31_part_00
MFKRVIVTVFSLMVFFSHSLFSGIKFNTGN